MPVAIRVKDLKVVSLDLDFQEISWELEDTTQDVLDYTFQVLRSESFSGPFEEICAPFEDRYIFRDNALQVAHRWRTYFYLIRVTHKATGDVADFGPSAKEPQPDLQAIEIRRHVQHLFREHAGRRCWLLPVRTFGERCDCWSPHLQKRVRSNCLRCYSTGFVRGYLSPIEIWGQIDPSPKSEQNTNVGAQQQVNSTGRFGAFPPIKPRDLIIEAENKRWRVVAVSQTEKARARIHQEISIHQIPERDVEFAITLDLGMALRDLVTVPARNLTNPHNLESFEGEEIPNIFGLYPTTYPSSR